MLPNKKQHLPNTLGSWVRQGVRGVLILHCADKTVQFIFTLSSTLRRQSHCVGKVLFDLHTSGTIWFRACSIWVAANIAGGLENSLIYFKGKVFSDCSHSSLILKMTGRFSLGINCHLPKSSGHQQVLGIHCLCYKNSTLTTIVYCALNSQVFLCICHFLVFENVFSFAFKLVIFLVSKWMTAKPESHQGTVTE